MGDYLGKHDITTRALIGGKKGDAVLLALRMEVGAKDTEYGHSLEAEKSKEIDFP